MSEFDSYPHFEKYLQERNYQTRTCVKMPKMNNIEFDIVGIRKHKTQNKYYLASIEVKEYNVNRVIQQAYTRTMFCNYCYIAFPIDGYFGYVIHRITEQFNQLKEKNIGVLLWDDVRKRIFTVLGAKMSDRIAPSLRKKLMDKLLQGRLGVEN